MSAEAATNGAAGAARAVSQKGRSGHKWTPAQRKLFQATMRAKRLEREKGRKVAGVVPDRRPPGRPKRTGDRASDAIVYLEHAQRAAMRNASGGEISDEGLFAILALRALTGRAE